MFINIHSHKFNGSADIVIYNKMLDNFKNSEELFSVGLHPWNIDETDIYLLNNLQNNLTKITFNKNTLAIGEIGLDKNIDTPISVQTKILQIQLEISEQLKLPVILHIVKSYSEIIKLRNLKKGKTKYIQPWIIHGFNKKYELVQQLIKSGFYISFGVSILNNLPHVEKSLIEVPNNKLFLETDESDVSIVDIYKKVAEIKRVSVDELQHIIYNNFKRVFSRYDG
ncbi:MAG: TatD family hydrolase [Ichthyobacteriaceae bacterium]|nr:TatD family hydrolase [Ichthyobacteriaceae bacterium]